MTDFLLLRATSGSRSATLRCVRGTLRVTETSSQRVQREELQPACRPRAGGAGWLGVRARGLLRGLAGRRVGEQAAEQAAGVQALAEARLVGVLGRLAHQLVERDGVVAHQDAPAFGAHPVEDLL